MERSACVDVLLDEVQRERDEPSPDSASKWAAGPEPGGLALGLRAPANKHPERKLPFQRSGRAMLSTDGSIVLGLTRGTRRGLSPFGATDGMPLA